MTPSARRLSLVLAATLGVVPACAALADAISLRASVRLPERTDVIRLRDVARLDGPEAERYADTRVGTLTDPERPVTLRLSEIRDVLTEAGVHWGRVHLSGNRVIVRPRTSGAAAPPMAMNVASIDGVSTTGATTERPRRTTTPEPESAAQIAGRDTRRGLVARTVAHGLGVDPADLRLAFEPGVDEAWLDAPLGGAPYEIDPRTSYRSDRIELEIRLWRDGRIAERTDVRLRPQLRLDAVRLRHDVPRNAVLTEADLETVEAWLAPGAHRLHAPRADAVGRVTGHPLRAGAVVQKRDVKRATLISRGDHVTVRCVVGSLAISMAAQARADGGLGERIPFRKTGERGEFLAEVTGPGEAVVDLSRPVPAAAAAEESGS